MEEGDRSAIGRAWFWDEGSAALFCSVGHESSGEDDFSEALEIVTPFRGEASKDIECIVLVADF